MIGVKRGAEGPSALVKPYPKGVKLPKLPGKTETESVLKSIEGYRKKLVAHGQAVAKAKKEGKPEPKPPKFSFPYDRYSEREVVKELADLFEKKCAYCESLYAGTQPMDVEHWRPKGEVHESDGTVVKPGYYWLAAEWTNLLPSCIDCNRGRTQYDQLHKKNVVLGKKNQFPVRSGRTLQHEEDPANAGGQEKPLLINPCLEDPEGFFRYDEIGVMHPRSDEAVAWERAMKSIQVYALNRADLVSQRKAVVLQIDHRIKMISRLGEIRQTLRKKKLTVEADALSDLIDEEIDALLEMRRPQRAYAALARYLIAEVHKKVMAGLRPGGVAPVAAG